MLSKIRAKFSEIRAAQLLKSVHPTTLSRHSEIVKWAEAAAERGLPPQEEDPPLANLLDRFRDLFASLDMRALVHLPSGNVSPAGESWMANLIMAMHFLGIRADTLDWNADIKTVLEELQPTLLITSGHESYLDRIDWEAVTRYRTAGRLLVGLAAPADEETQREWVDSLLHWSQEHPVDFFYNWTPPEYGRDRRYDRYRDAGYPVFTIEFGANPLAYRPIPDIERDLDYVFLGSFHGEKVDRYVSHFGPILNRHPGFLLGPGWPTGMTTIPRPTHSFLYARARVGINVHIPNLLKEPRTLDERVFNLAAAEVPVLIDNPALLTMRFSPDAFFIAENEKEFHELFEYILSDPAEARRRAQQARREVLERFTLFHVIENLVKQLRTLL